MNASHSVDAHVPAGMHPDEWAARLELAACYRVFDHLGWTELIYNHITLRLPDSVSGERQAVPDQPVWPALRRSRPATWSRSTCRARCSTARRTRSTRPASCCTPTIHGGIEGAHCVMHTHTTAGVAVACLQGGLQQTNFYSAQLHGMLAYHDFEGITIHAEEGPRVLASIGDKPAVILRNHGLLSWGASVPHAFAILWTLQRACEIQAGHPGHGRADRDP